MGKLWSEQVRERDRQRRRDERERRIRRREREARNRREAIGHPVRAAYRRFWLGR